MPFHVAKPYQFHREKDGWFNANPLKNLLLVFFNILYKNWHEICIGRSNNKQKIVFMKKTIIAASVIGAMFLANLANAQKTATTPAAKEKKSEKPAAKKADDKTAKTQEAKPASDMKGAKGESKGGKKTTKKAAPAADKK